MKPTLKNLSNELTRKGIRLSHQRLKILEYLTHHQGHPTVDQIYDNLQREIPTLSKTTIYNTLNTLIESGLVRAVAIEDHETRYDIITENHGHFKCESCGTIHDFGIDIDSFASKGLDGFQINQKDVYFKGTCPKCILSLEKVK